MNAQCPYDETDAVRYAAGEMPPEEADRYERHLTDCPICAAAVEGEREVASWMRTLPARYPRAETIAALAKAAREMAAREPWHARIREWLAPREWLIPAAGWALAASLLIAAGWFLHRGQTAPISSASSLAWDDSTSFMTKMPYIEGTLAEYAYTWDDTQESALNMDLAALSEKIDVLAVSIEEF